MIHDIKNYTEQVHKATEAGSFEKLYTDFIIAISNKDNYE